MSLRMIIKIYVSNTIDNRSCYRYYMQNFMFDYIFHKVIYIYIKGIGKMLLGVNKSLLALTVVAGTLLTGCNETSPDPKSTNPTKSVVKPDAPTGPIANDDLDQFRWTWSPNFTGKQFYEIKVQGQPWVTVNGNPHQLVIDVVYAIGDIQVRVKADSSKKRSTSDVLVNTLPYTENIDPRRPSAPTAPLQNDNLNTFDWTFVNGFHNISDYEYSLTGGVDWTTVVDKPLVVGDVDIDAGYVLVRVKANVATGMFAGKALISTQAFTASVPIVIDAPTLPEIVNEHIGSTSHLKEVKTNGFSWGWVTNTKVIYNKPEYYEFTNDGGSTWQPVVSKPQHIGQKVYDKSKVGVRVKKNAIPNQINPAGQVLFATAASADFYVTRVVPMKTWNQAQKLTSTGNWTEADDDGCYIEYDVSGKNPQFWAYAGLKDSADGVLDKLNPAFCGMPSWRLLSTAEMMAKTLVNSDYVPSALGKYLISDYSYWALESDAVTLKKIRAGKENTRAYDYASVVVNWPVPDTAEIVAESVSVNKGIQKSVSSHGGKWKATSADIIDLIKRIEQLSVQPLSPLLSDVQVLGNQTKATFDAFDLEVTKYKDRLYSLVVYSTILESDKNIDDSIKALIKENTALANLDFIKLTALHTSFDTALKVTNALTALAQLMDQSNTANTTQDELIAATDGAIIHAKSLDLFALASIINDFIKANMNITADLKTATDQLVKEDNTALLSALNKLWVMFNDLPTLADVDELNTVAEAGLKRASAKGYEVAAVDAVIGASFYKLDMNGGYLPSATSYAQGWRCVMDNRDLLHKRIWTLLKDGLPNGADDLAFDASSSGIASVIGTGGLVESTQATQLCGRSNWALPSLEQLISLETDSIKNYATIDVDVFPHHLAFNPEYDIDNYLRGIVPATQFWYWAAEERKNTDEQITYHYRTVNNRSSSGSASKQGDEDKVVLGRLVSEIKLSYQLRDSAGVKTSNIDDAVCAYQPETKQTWQLFDTAELAARSKEYGNTSSDADSVLAEVTKLNSSNLCNKSNWRIPSIAELELLSPVDNQIFRYSNVEKEGSSRCYVSADDAQHGRQKCYYVTTEKTSDVDKKPRKSNSYVYRLIASD